MESVEPGTLYVVATPIGNLEDLTYRAARVLGDVDVLACEDTRVTRKLFERYDLPKPHTFFAHHEHNEQQAAGRILGFLRDGVSVAVCSDSGFPAISDPGYRIIDACRAEGLPIVLIPGPSAVVSALVLSGLPTSSFTFLGFPPRKSGQRQRFFAAEADRPHTLLCFESPHRIGKTLADAEAVLGNRLAAVCFELTKKFERVDRRGLGALAGDYGGKTVKGEITLVIAGCNPKFLIEDTREWPPAEVGGGGGGRKKPDEEHPPTA